MSESGDTYAVMPTPTSTVVQIAKSDVRYKNSPLYSFIVHVYGKRMMVAVLPLPDLSVKSSDGLLRSNIHSGKTND